jgi:choline dehydrogenase-like flavoprotein
MIRDLTTDPPSHDLNCDVAIIGAGVAGLVLADRLRRGGKRVVILESGGREQTDDVHPLNTVEQLGARYRGASEGRFRCLGGTSTRWGGALIPFLAEDLNERLALGLPAWPVDLTAVETYLPEIERLFGLDTGPYDGAALLGRDAGAFGDLCADDDFTVRFAKWPAFKRRNLATLFQSSLKRDPGLEVWLNATATEFELDEASARIRSVTAQSLDGQRVRVVAPHFVISAGAIESTRLLLLIDSFNERKVFAGCESLGLYFHDHLSAPMASIEATDATALNHLAGIRFDQNGMRSLRFELSPSAQQSEGTGGGFAHISFAPLKPSGFDALRQFLRSIQRGRPAVGALGGAVLDAPYLLRAALWRYGRSQLYWPQPARYELHIVAEQLPDRRNRISLSSKLDPFGLPLAAVDWRARPSEVRTFNGLIRRFDSFWRRRGLTRIGRLNWFTPPGALVLDGLAQAGDVYHPGGSTRMGTDPKTSVVDGDLTVHALQNLSVLSTSVFPAGAGANPTLTLMLFALRLGDRLAMSSPGGLCTTER